MAIVSDVEIRLRADIARLQTDMTSARRTVESGFDSISKAADKLKSTLAGLGLGLGFAELAKQMIEAQREFDKLNSSLVTATGSSENAAQAFKALQKFAASTPYDLKQTTEAFLKLRNLGLTPSERALTSYGNTAGALGKDLMQMVEAVADATTGEFERLKEFGIKAEQNGDTVRLTFQGVTTTVANNAAAIEKYLIALGETKFAGGMELQAKTLDGAISNLGDNWQAVLRTFNQQGFGDIARSSVLALSEALPNLQAIIKAFGDNAESVGEQEKKFGVATGALTAIFETVAVLGNEIGFVFRTLGRELGAFAAGFSTFLSGVGGGLNGLAKAVDGLFKGGWGDSTAVAKGFSEALDSVTTSFKGVMAISDQVTADSEADRKATDARTAAILGAAAAARAAAEEDAKDTTDKLARYKVVASAQQQATQAALDFYKKTMEASKDAVDALVQDNARLMDGREELSTEEKNRIKVLNDLAVAGKTLSAQQKKDIAGWQDLIVALSKVKKEEQDLRDLRDQRIADARSEVAAAEKQTQSLQDQVKYYGLTEDAVLSLQAAEYERQAQNENIDGIERGRLEGLLEQTQEQIALQKQLTKMKAETSFWTSLEDAAHQTFLSIGDGSKDLWTRMKESAKNIFFEWLYQMTLKKWIINIGLETSGSSAVSGIAGALSGSSSGGSGLLSAFSSGSSLYSAGQTIYNGFSAGIASSLGSSIASLGNLFGSQAVSAFGTGLTLTTSQAASASAAYGAAGNATAASGLSAGASAASAVPIIGWIIAGMIANSSYYKQGWRIDNQKTDIAKELLASTLKGNFLGPVGAVATVGIGVAETLLKKLGVGGALASTLSGSALWTKAFGHQAPTIESQGVRGTISAAGVDAETYANILEKGGWFRSDKRYTNTADLSSETATAWTDTLKSMISAVKGFGNVLGIQADAINGYTKTFDLKLTGNEETDAATITQFFSDMGDELSTMLVPSLASFQAEGETLSATLQRLVSDYVAVDDAFAAIGRTVGITGEQGIKAREGLIAAAGGLEALQSGLSYFQQNFLSAAEQLAPVQKEVSEFLASIGQSQLTTIDQYKAYALGLDVTTEAGQALFAQLLAMAPAFKEVADAATAAQEAADAAAASAATEYNNLLSLQAQLYDVTGDKVAAAAVLEKQRAIALAALSPVLQQATKDLWAAQDAAAALAAAKSAAVDAANAAFDALSTAISSRKDEITSQFQAVIDGMSSAISAVQDGISNLKSVVSIVDTSVNSLLGTTASAARAQIRELARSFSVPLASDLQSLISAAQNDPTEYSTAFEAQRAQLLLANDLETISGTASANLDNATAMLAALQSEKAAIETARDLQLQRLDSMLTAAQAQIDAINGVNDSVLTVAAALSAFASSVTGTGAATAAWQSSAFSEANTAYVTAGQTTFFDSYAVVQHLQAIAASTASAAAATASTASSTTQLANQFDTVSAGGNALLTESSGVTKVTTV